MAGDIVELVEESNKKADRILLLLEGDRHSPGLIDQIKKNTADIDTLKSAGERCVTVTSTLASVALLFFFLVPVAIFMDRYFLISEIRYNLNIADVWAALVSSVIGLFAQGMAIFVILVFTNRLWGLR